MASDRASASDDTAAAAARGARRLTRGIAATWWYTVSAVILFEVVLVVVWVTTLLAAGFDTASLVAVGIGGLVWWGSTLLLLSDYRHRAEDAPVARWRRVVAPLLIALTFGLIAGLASGVWLMGVLPFVQSVLLLNWPPGVRVRIVATATLLLTGLWIVDAQGAFAGGESGIESNWWLVGFFSTFLPAMSVISLWWWDVLVALDRARASEAKLAATQERLRVATDVHDLQGHHLQVIALQLELAERLMSRDPDAALEQLRASRTSVDEARQGTRDLATRFRSVPLRDELANAADLLRAAGTEVEVSVDRDADEAPGSVLGPVIRETTTNVLRHGDGAWTRLSLSRDGALWRYEIANDVASERPAGRGGAGLEGLGRRAADAGGTLEVHAGDQEFAVTMTVPGQPGGAG